MKKFADMGIMPVSKNFTGDKIDMMDILNKEITVHDWKVTDSKYKKGEERGICLYLSITIDGKMRLAFSGSRRLLETIERIPKENFPFQTTITKIFKAFQFT